MSEHLYVLKRDPVDERDHKFSSVISPVQSVKLPREVDLREKCPPVYNQGSLGSCTANAGNAARSMLLGKPEVMFSRLFLYYKERELGNTIPEDSGASMRDICKALNKFGVCEEGFFPYNITKFTEAPTVDAATNALKYTISTYTSLNTVKDIKACLALRQQPVLIGMEVYEQFESIGKDGLQKLPKKTEKSLGGHAILIVGYKVIGRKTYFIVRNSWGAEWGDNGYFYMPTDYITKGYAYDFWSIG